MKITLEFVGWLDERLYSRAVCGLLEKRAICPPLEAERNFEAKRKGEREGEREREGGSQSIELLDAGFHVCFTCYEFRTSNSFSFFSYNLSLYRIGSQSKISNRSFYPIGLDKLAKLKDRQS